MQELVASYRSVEANITSLQVASERQSLAVQINGNKNSSNVLNPQQRQIVDDVGISDAALKKYEEAQILAEQLQDYLDYLQGDQAINLPRIQEANDGPSVTIAGQSSNIAASITVGSITEKTLEIAASFDDNGSLSELTVTKTQTTVEFIQADIILEDRQFYAAA